jgi:DNA-binding transcriptional MocR family regulator
MFIWAERPGQDPNALVQAAAAKDILLAPGQLFRPQLQSTSFLRFNAVYLGDPRFLAFLQSLP